MASGRKPCANAQRSTCPAPARSLEHTGIEVLSRRILLITPFAADRAALAELLRAEGHEVACVASRDAGREAALAEHPDIIIADAQLPGCDGLAAVRELSRHGLSPRIILLCPRASRALEHLGVVCLTKPIDLDRLHQMLCEPLAAHARVA